jgi:predicted alpha/beta-hydrolase family hydrolase
MTGNPAAANESRETGIKPGRDHVLIGRAAGIPVSAPTPVISVAPVVLPAPGRPVDLQVRISAPTAGAGLPVILLSHGGGVSNYLSSLLGFGPLVDFWAARGFAVIQPTHLTSNSLGLDASKSPGFPESRIQDMVMILDNLDVLQDAVPGLAGRLDPDRIAVAGHSFGGQTAGMLLGEQFTDADGTVVYAPDARVKAGVLLAAPGAGGDHLTPAAAAMPSLRTADFGKMTTPALVVVGDQDHATILTSRGASYSADAYHLSPGPKSLATLHGAEHLLGGITGYDAAATTDENPERLALVQRLTWAYLRSALDPGDPAWPAACDAFANLTDLGHFESK